MNRIIEIIDQLKKIGYRQKHINEFFENCIGRANLTNLTPDEKAELTAFLEHQLKFAVKCIKVLR